MSKRQIPNKPPDFLPEKTYGALKKQLDSLKELQGRNNREVANEVRTWTNLTENILIHGFGEASTNVTQFKHAGLTGASWHPGKSEGQIQLDFERRIDAYAATVKSSLAELQLMMPEPEVAGSYEPGDTYLFYRDLKTIVGLATRELFIIDNFLDTQLFDIYMENLNSSVSASVLTNNVIYTVRLIAEKFAVNGMLELRSSSDVHDRVVFADERCWVIGQSIKDAAQKKPTYIVEHSGAASMRKIYEELWTRATVVLKH